MNWKNDKNEIMFHLRRLPDKFASDGNRLVLNSCNFPNGEESRDWGTEEYIPFSPADVGDSIHLRQIAVVVDDTGFQVAWGGKVQYLFKHRLPWCSFKNFEVDPKWENSPDRTCTEKKSTTLQHILMSMCITRGPAEKEVLEKDSNTLFHKEVRGSGTFRVATWEGKERKLLKVEQDTPCHQIRVKIGNIKEFICTVLDVPELTKQEFDKWNKLRGTSWNTIFSTSKEKQTLITVAKQNCEVLLTLHEEGVLLELVLENSKPLLVSVVFSGVMCQYARELHSRDHRRSSHTDVLAAVLEHLACSIVRRVQLLQPARSFQRDYTSTILGKEMDEVLEFATTHRMKAFISEPVIVSLVNNRWSDTTCIFNVAKLIPHFLDPSNYINTFVRCLVIPFRLIYFIFWAYPLVFLISSWPPAWRFWAFQTSYLTYAMLAWYLPLLCTTLGALKESESRNWRNACLEDGQADDDCCGALNLT
jgi:hypothetical protein